MGISHLHARKIAHRDLKLENLLYDSETKKITLIDFGLARKKKSKYSNFDDACGTCEYIAPEVLKFKPFDQKCDLWAVGVLTYCLLNHGNHPFPNSEEGPQE